MSAENSELRAALLEQGKARERLEQRLRHLRQVRARVRAIAHALDIAMAGRADDRALAERRELAKARHEAATAKVALVNLRLAHWRASNAASAERLALEKAQAADARQRAGSGPTLPQGLDDGDPEAAS